MEDTYLFIDTETTGFKKSGPLVQEGQARVCQVAMILSDHQGRPLAEFCSLIKPDGWEISDGAFKVHGISNDMCEKYGVQAEPVIYFFKAFSGRATKIVAHNEQFDRGMMDVECAYFGDESPEHKPWFCTMKSNTHITPGGKWPKLDAALKHYCNKDLVNAHDAMADTRACRDIFFAMRGIQVAA